MLDGRPNISSNGETPVEQCIAVLYKQTTSDADTVPVCLPRDIGVQHLEQRPVEPFHHSNTLWVIGSGS